MSIDTYVIEATNTILTGNTNFRKKVGFFNKYILQLKNICIFN